MLYVSMIKLVWIGLSIVQHYKMEKVLTYEDQRIVLGCIQSLVLQDLNRMKATGGMGHSKMKVAKSKFYDLIWPEASQKLKVQIHFDSWVPNNLAEMKLCIWRCLKAYFLVGRVKQKYTEKVLLDGLDHIWINKIIEVILYSEVFSLDVDSY